MNRYKIIATFMEHIASMVVESHNEKSAIAKMAIFFAKEMNEDLTGFDFSYVKETSEPAGDPYYSGGYHYVT